MSQSSSDQKASIVSNLVSRLLKTKSQAAMLDLLRGETRPPTSKALSSDVKAHVSVLQEHLRGDRPREAIATALAMLFVDADHAVSCMRRAGALRASSYGYKGSLIGRVAKAALSVRDLLSASPDRIVWLESVEALSRIAGNALSLHKEIEQTIKAHRTVVLKTIFVTINSLLYHGWRNDHEASSLEGHRYSSEDYAEGASLILRIYAGLFPIDDACFNHADTKLGPNVVTYNRLLIAAVRLTKYKEAEFFIDGLPYRADAKGETVTISSIDPDLERSVRLGYMQSDGQAMLRLSGLHKSEVGFSIRELIDRGFERGGFDEMLEIVEQPVRRLRLQLPTLPAFFDTLFRRDELYKDELQMLLVLDVENFGEIDDLIFPITERVSSMDIFRVQRFFNFVSSAYQRWLADLEDPVEVRHLTLTSTVLILPHDSLMDLMKLIFDDEDKSREIIGLLAMDPSEPHLDLQYRPFVDIGNYYVIPPHVVAASNLVRNTIIANRLREAAIGPKDRMVDSVAKAMRAAGFEVETDFEAKIAGLKLEFDIIARRDSALFLFECKNAYHPASVHEMRNSWDHIRKGRKQLDERRTALSAPANQTLLFEKLGWSAGAACSVNTGIVIANRVFHGANLNGHPIRQAHELINVLMTGRIVAEEYSLSFWLGTEFQTDDLIAYLGPDSIAAEQLEALDPRTWTYAMGYRDLAFSSYVLDMAKYDEMLREKHGPPIPGGRSNETV